MEIKINSRVVRSQNFLASRFSTGFGERPARTIHLLIVLLGLNNSIWGQGAVNFNNRVTPAATGVVAPIYGPEPSDPCFVKRGNATTNGGTQTYTGPLLLGTGFTAQLWAGPAGTEEAALQAVADPNGTTRFRTTTSFGGFFSPRNSVIISGVPAGAQVTLQIRVWDNQGGTITHWAGVLANQSILQGTSELFTSPPLVEPPGTAPNLIGLTSFNLHLGCPTNAPEILMQPEGQVALFGSNATFAVETGNSLNSFQWRFNGMDLSGASNSVLALTNVQLTDAGEYDVVVTNYYGAVTSVVARLIVTYGLALNVQRSGTIAIDPPQDAFLPGSSVTLTAVPGANFGFAYWSGDSAGSSNPLTIMMDGHKSITAVFYSAVVGIAIEGQGSVTRSPDKHLYDFGESLTLSALPGRWYAFTRWGDGPTANPRTNGVHPHEKASGPRRGAAISGSSPARRYLAGRWNPPCV
jgi:hypothetical protein